MKFARPDKLNQALGLLESEKWTVLSGGTDFYPALRDQQATGPVLDITALDELRQMVQEDQYWRIGALITWSDIITTKLPAAFDGLKLAARDVGSVQIQNRASVVGNICNASPAADGVPPLLTLDAEVELVSKTGLRKMPLEDFITANRTTALRGDELVSAILIPINSTRGCSTFLKLGARKYLVISIAMISVRLACDQQRRISDVAISVGSCSEVAQRLKTLEQALVGQSITIDMNEAVKPKHVDSLTPINDVRASKSYRQQAAMQLIQRGLNATAQQLV